MRRLLVVLAFALGGGAGAAAADPPTTHEYLTDRPSGFWTSNRPAVNGAYRYRLMLIGLGVLAITGVLTYRLVQRTAGARSGR